jgi:hypothetical protein
LETMSKWTYVNGRNSSSMSAGWNGTISCGFYDSHDYGCRNETSDSTAVWVQAMLWAATGDLKWATRAIDILNFYGKNLKAYGDFGNAKLEAAWAADKWARSAELLSSTGAPWALKDVAAFKRVLATVSVPMLYNGSCYNGNWELAMIEGLSSIAVFTENTTLWDHAIQMWQARLPAYFYMATDGPKPVDVPSCGTSNWHGQIVFNASVNGVSQETCRDFGHLSYGTHTVFIRYSHCIHTVLTLYSHCTHTVLTLYSYCTHTVLTLYSHCTHTVLTLYSHCILTLYSYCILILHTHTAYSYCKLILHTHCILILHTHTAYSYCILTAYSYCILILHTHCILILHTHTAYSYCILILHTRRPCIHLQRRGDGIGSRRRSVHPARRPAASRSRVPHQVPE